MKMPKTIVQFKEKIKKEVNGKVDAIILYGSVARGAANKNSDIDIFILMRGNVYGKKNSLEREKISKMRTEIDLKNNSLTSIIYYPVKNFLKRYKFDPFLKNVIKEGKILYDTGIFSKASKRSTEAS